MDLAASCGTIGFVSSRWVLGVVLVLVVAVTGTAGAGVFKPRGGTKTSAKKTAPVAASSKKQPTRTTTTTPRRVVTTKKAPGKKGSRVATKGRPNAPTPDPRKGEDVVITEDEEDDVIIRDD